MHGTGGMLQLRLDRSARVIVACAVLHNIAVENNVDLVLGEGEEDLALAVPAEAEEGPRGVQAGVRARQHLVDTFFTWSC